MNWREVMRSGRHLVLALLMLLMQQAAWRHTLQHDLGEDSKAAHTQCVLCLAFHAADQAVSPSPVPAILADLAFAAPTPPAFTPLLARVHAVFQARAPPAFLS